MSLEGQINPVKVDGWPSVYPIKGDVGIVSCAASKLTLLKVTTIPTALDSNAGRRGLIVFNGGTTSVYLAYGSLVDSKANITYILPTLGSWVMPLPVYTGMISFVRASGDGQLCITELV